MDVIHPDFRKHFGMDEQTVRWTENWKNGHVWKVVNSDMKSNRRPETNDLDARVGHTLNKFAD